MLNYHCRTKKQRQRAEFCRKDIGNFDALAPLLSGSGRVVVNDSWLNGRGCTVVVERILGRFLGRLP